MRRPTCSPDDPGPCPRLLPSPPFETLDASLNGPACECQSGALTAGDRALREEVAVDRVRERQRHVAAHITPGDRELALHVPDAGRGPVDRQVGLAVAVVVAGQ